MKTYIIKTLLLACLLFSSLSASAQDEKYFPFKWDAQQGRITAKIYYHQYLPYKLRLWHFYGYVTMSKIQSNNYFFYDARVKPEPQYIEWIYNTSGSVRLGDFTYDNNHNRCEVVTCHYPLPFHSTSIKQIRELLETGATDWPVGVNGSWYRTGIDKPVKFETTVKATIERPIPSNVITSFNPESNELTLTWSYKMFRFDAPYYFVFFRREKSASDWQAIKTAKVMVEKGFNTKTEKITLPVTDDDLGKEWEYAVALAFDSKSEANYNKELARTANVFVARAKPKNLQFQLEQPNKLTLTWEYDNPQKIRRVYRIYRQISGDSIPQVLTPITEAKAKVEGQESFTTLLETEYMDKEWTYWIDLVSDVSIPYQLTKDTCRANLTIPYPRELEAAFDETNNQLTLDWDYGNPLGFPWTWRLYRKEKEAETWESHIDQKAAGTGNALKANSLLTLEPEAIGKAWVYAVSLEEGEAKNTPSEDLFTSLIDINIVPPYPDSLHASFLLKEKQIELNWIYSNPYKLPWQWHIYKREKESDQWIFVSDSVKMAFGNNLTANVVIPVAKEDYDKEWHYAVRVSSGQVADTPSRDEHTQYTEINTNVPKYWLLWAGAGVFIVFASFFIRKRKKKV